MSLEGGSSERGPPSARRDNDVIATYEADEFLDAAQEENEIPTFAVRMLNIAREFAIFCILMITYAALTKDPPKITKSPAAYPFFPEDSIVRDWYRGEISRGIEYARSSDVAFVMYYAPWDAQSQATRREFEMAAEYLRDTVTFIAINCWQPQSECRRHYSKVYRWPVLIAYTSHGRGVQYAGLLKSAHMIKFLKKFVAPVQRLNALLEFEDVYAIATVDTSPGSRDFVAYYLAALKYLERDPMYQISFYVNSKSVAFPSLTLHLWNETLFYPLDSKWSPDDILQWIFDVSHQVTSWIVPTGSKSNVFSTAIKDGPFLLLFTPRNPLLSGSDYYYLLQEVGVEYYSCNDNRITDFHAATIKLKRSANLLRYIQAKTMCKSEQNLPSRRIVAHLNPVWSNTSSCLQKDYKQHCKLFTDSNLRSICSQIATGNCKEGVRVDKKECVGSFSDYNTLHKTPMDVGINDPLSAMNLLKYWQKEKCRQLHAAENLHPAGFDNATISKDKVNISGFSCMTNKTLSLLAMDSLLHYHFAEKLGVDLRKAVDRTVAVIVNPEMESHYVLKEPVNGHSLRQFIYNFSRNHLIRSFDSITTITPPKQNTAKRKPHDDTSISIQELNSESFMPTIMQNDKNVVVFYYTKQCAFCSGIAHVFLTVSRKLRYLKNLVFARIDGELNILPWEYTMESYPTVIFLPANRKSESRVFQTGIAMNVPNLIGFILTNLEPYHKLQAMWSICMQVKIKGDQSSCYKMLLGDTLGHIDKTLTEWRKSNNRQKKHILHKLKQLRHLHLSFAHSPQDIENIDVYFAKLNQQVNSERDYRDEL